MESEEAGLGRYGRAGSPNFFSSVHVRCYKDAKPVIVAFQKNEPYGMFCGIFTGSGIEEIKFFEKYHSYRNYDASWFDNNFFSLGNAGEMKVLRLVNVNL